MSGRELADLIDTSTQQLYRLEMGERRLTDGWMEKLSAALDCHPFDLLGIKLKPNTALVTAFVAIDCRLLPYESPGTITLPSQLSGLVAVRVNDEAMWPRYEPGDVILYAPPTGAWSPEACLGHECILETAAGSMFIKRLLPGSTRDTYRLTSFREDAIEKVRVKWAAPIAWVMRNAKSSD